MQSSLTIERKSIIYVSTSSLVITVSTLFVLLFGYTGMSKLLNVKQFIGAMYKAELIRPYAAYLAYIVPIAELAICLLLLKPFFTFKKRVIPTRTIGLYGSAFMMLLFTGYVGVTLAFYKHNLPCTCGGFISSLTWRQHLLFNIFFLLLSVFTLLSIYKNKVIKYN